MSRWKRVLAAGALTLAACDDELGPDVHPRAGQVDLPKVESPNKPPPPDKDAFIGFNAVVTQTDYEVALKEATKQRLQTLEALTRAFGDYVDAVVLAEAIDTTKSADGQRTLTTLVIKEAAKGAPPEKIMLAQWNTVMHPPADLPLGKQHVLLINESSLDGGAWVLAVAGAPNVMYPASAGFAAPGLSPTSWAAIQKAVKAW